MILHGPDYKTILEWIATGEEKKIMSEVTGPISTLPGTHRSPPAGTKCDHHPNRNATHRIQGETDSMGCEMHDLCDSCTKRFRAEMASAAARTGMCDWCKCEAADLRPRRDYDEGLCGPVYQVCGACVKRQSERIAAEIEEYDDQDSLEGWDYE
jgi:hypothetical protein